MFKLIFDAFNLKKQMLFLKLIANNKIVFSSMNYENRQFLSKFVALIILFNYDKRKTNAALTFEDFKTEVLNDYKIAITSRECSLLGRKEVLTGKAKFGIFGDGKEVPQLAMAKSFKNGDFRSGYYRDQTFMMAIGQLTVQQFFAGLYGHTDIEQEPMSAGRQMGGHFVTHSLNNDGTWKDLTKQKIQVLIYLQQLHKCQDCWDLHKHQKYTDKFVE